MSQLDRCRICGKRFEWEERECPRCKSLRDLFGDKFGIIEGWVRAIANEEASDAVLGHENDVEHP